MTITSAPLEEVEHTSANNASRDQPHYNEGAYSSRDSLSSDLSLYAGDVLNGSEYVHHRLRSPVGLPLGISIHHLPRTWRTTLLEVWLQSKGLIFVILSQFFGASMNLIAGVLETDGSHGKAMHPFQILFARMSLTAVASYLYMWYTKIRHPFGTRNLQLLLILRSIGGFFQVFGMYCSLLYIPLSEATVYTFLAPIIACYVYSYLVSNEPFNRKQQLAGIISLLGVVLVSQSFSAPSEDGSLSTDGFSPNTTVSISSDITQEPEPADSYHHILAIISALTGVLGAACSFVTIRWIGTRTHALVSVTYFTTVTTFISVLAVLAIPSVSFRLPGNLLEWTLLLGLGVAGFLLQYLMTVGLAYIPPLLPGQSNRKDRSSDHGSRATLMIYTQILFALFFDRMIWNRLPSLMSWLGSGLILSSAIYVGVVQERIKTSDNTQDSVYGLVITSHECLQDEAHE
ncbi:hypothetical protein GQ44DRAFT_694773 [Phaeosphaeriaceae sp. PMI808]|nr:hypothetical protein GQ44DRAFT_694773 [Phaeosphaeriaceae sp. PMI808]